MSGLLQHLAELAPGQPLFAAGQARITAGQIRRTARAIAAQLPDCTRIYLHTSSASLFAAGLLAAAERGVEVHLPAHLQRGYLREIDAEPGLVLSDGHAGDGGVSLALSGGEDDVWSAVPVDPGLVFYTSGVTNAPKRVVKSIGQLDAEALVLERLWGPRAGAVRATVSHQHIYGMLFRIFWPVMAGRLSDDRAAENWEALAGRLDDGVTLVSSPAHLTRLPPVSGLPPCAPGLIFTSGAPLPLSAAQEARVRLGALPIEVLGSTETGGIAWRQQASAEALWTPMPGVRATANADGLLEVMSVVAGNDAIVTGDAVAFVDERFQLSGRADKIVKIDGKRVSLTRVEQALLALPVVDAAAAIDLPARKGALGAIVTLNAQGQSQLTAQGAFRLSRDLRKALGELLDPSERPKHWKFGPVPVNRQGKPVQAILRKYFESPPVQEFGRGRLVAVDGDMAELQLEFPADLLWFEGHFPEVPILPGIAQVHLAVRWALHLWGWQPEGSRLMQLKFRHVIQPGNVVHLKLSRDLSLGRLKFSYEFPGGPASDGIIGGAE